MKTDENIYVQKYCFKEVLDVDRCTAALLKAFEDCEENQWV